MKRIRSSERGMECGARVNMYCFEVLVNMEIDGQRERERKGTAMSATIIGVYLDYYVIHAE